METLSISKENALKTYEEVNEKGKKFLANLFGEKVFIRDITERVKIFSDALEYTGETIEQFEERTKFDSLDEVAYKKLKVIVLALNEGESMDYKDTSVYKYYPWFNSVGSGAGFSYYDYSYDFSSSYVGSRLCFKTRELAKYAGKQFLAEYNEYINA